MQSHDNNNISGGNNNPSKTIQNFTFQRRQVSRCRTAIIHPKVYFETLLAKPEPLYRISRRTSAGGHVHPLHDQIAKTIIAETSSREQKFSANDGKISGLSSHPSPKYLDDTLRDFLKVRVEMFRMMRARCVQTYPQTPFWIIHTTPPMMLLDTFLRYSQKTERHVLP